MTARRARLPSTVLIPVLVLAGAACGGSRARVARPATELACTVLPAPANPPDSLSVAVTSPIDQRNAPLPTNAAERLAFAHLYETLVRVDCLDRVIPGLAVSWTPDETRTRWRMVLRDDARFWSGDPVTASDVIAAWRQLGQLASAPLARRLAMSAAVIDDRTLDVTLTDSQPRVLGDPELAVHRRTSGSAWLEGTGPHRVRDAHAGLGRPPARRTLVLEPVDAGQAPRLTIHSTDVADARDLVDAGIDLLFTDDAALAAYAATRRDAVSLPLGWDQTWLLLTPLRATAGPQTRDSLALGTDSIDARALREALARDATGARARPAELPEWWQAARACTTITASSATSAPQRSSRIAYRHGDPIARALAERLAALAAIGDRGPGGASLAAIAPAILGAGDKVTTAPLGAEQFARALAAGSELAFVVPLPRASAAPCRELARLLAAAPWLGAGLSQTQTSPGVAPLIDTRLLAVARRDRLGLRLAWDSTATITIMAPHGGAPR